jgi:hypothetical protein
MYLGLTPSSTMLLPMQGDSAGCPTSSSRRAAPFHLVSCAYHEVKHPEPFQAA